MGKQWQGLSGIPPSKTTSRFTPVLSFWGGTPSLELAQLLEVCLQPEPKTLTMTKYYKVLKQTRCPSVFVPA